MPRASNAATTASCRAILLFACRRCSSAHARCLSSWNVSIMVEPKPKQPVPHAFDHLLAFSLRIDERHKHGGGTLIRVVIIAGIKSKPYPPPRHVQEISHRWHRHLSRWH